MRCSAHLAEKRDAVHGAACGSPEGWRRRPSPAALSALTGRRKLSTQFVGDAAAAYRRVIASRRRSAFENRFSSSTSRIRYMAASLPFVRACRGRRDWLQDPCPAAKTDDTRQRTVSRGRARTSNARLAGNASRGTAADGDADAPGIYLAIAERQPPGRCRKTSIHAMVAADFRRRSALSSVWALRRRRMLPGGDSRESLRDGATAWGW